MNMQHVKIYSVEDVPRLRFIANILLADILGLSWEVITDKRKLGKSPVINYSSEDIIGALQVIPDSLLFEKGIKTREVVVDAWNGLPVFFKTSSDSDFSFDIFAASFFLVTRYEEYLEFIPDKYGRFSASSSVAFKNGFLDIPIIEIWAKEMAKAFLKCFPTLTFKRNDYSALLTLDIDQPFAYLGKNILRSIGGLIRDVRQNAEGVSDRYRIVIKGEKDPYEVLDYITEKIENSNCDTRFFFPVGDHSDFDKNPSWKNSEYRKLIRKIAAKFKSGLHPSFYSIEKYDIIKMESIRLNTILSTEVTLSRFHYIRFFMPQSYRDIYKAGITEDYSMGYPDEPGFRAGIARPYYFYDVSEDIQTNLKIIPFQVMDVTLYNYKNLDPAGSREIILKLINQTRRVGGQFVSIWHNTSLLDNPEWQEWREVFEFMVKNQQP